VFQAEAKTLGWLRAYCVPGAMKQSKSLEQSEQRGRGSIQNKEACMGGRTWWRVLNRE
jgi:hypothetical protein